MRKLRTAALGLALGLSVPGLNTAHAIITRHDLPDEYYVVTDDKFPALVDLLKRGDCMGTLIHESYLLTVAHCAAELPKGKTLQIKGISNTVDKVILHPGWEKDSDGDPAKFDIALVHLKQPVKDVKPVPIYKKTDELGATVFLIGRGVHATGLVGEKGGKDDGKLRRASNRVAAVNQHSLTLIFRRPDDPGVMGTEGVGAAGDSGCPVFIVQNGVAYLAGLNSGGEDDGPIDIGKYGAKDYQTRVSQYLKWINDILSSK